MEHMSKNNHLLVSKKTKKKIAKSGKKKSTVIPGGGERQGKEEQWDLVSPQLSSLLQGKGNPPPLHVYVVMLIIICSIHRDRENRMEIGS